MIPLLFFWTVILALQVAGVISFASIGSSSGHPTTTSVVFQSIQPSTTTYLSQSLSDSFHEQDEAIQHTSPSRLVSRRNALVSTLSAIAATTTTAVSSIPLPAFAEEQPLTTTSSTTATPQVVPISAQWKAVDGLNSADKQFVSFDYRAYQAMTQDPNRTPYFQKAIEQRLLTQPENTLTVLDLGTGPFALFAIMAAQAGAKHVYAIEADPDICQSARQYAAKSGYADVITIYEGFSSAVQLPEKVDLCVAEIVGSIASEEGAYATIRDAYKRLVKEPQNPDSWIPNRIQTYAAPASYTLHNLFGPPEFDWNKLGGEPVRFSCQDRGLGLLADPQLVEDIAFADIMNTNKQQPQSTAVTVPQKYQLSFTVDAARMEINQKLLFDEFRRGKSSVTDSQRLAHETAHSVTGIALWPRLTLTNGRKAGDDGSNSFPPIVVDSRHYGDGGYQSSHWQTVLPIMAARPVGGLQGGEKVNVQFDFNLPGDNVDQSPSYSIQGTVNYNALV